MKVLLNFVYFSECPNFTTDQPAPKQITIPLNKLPWSLSKASIAEKSSSPTPTIIMLMGNSDADTIAALVSSKSVIIPSVKIRRTKYC